MAKVDERKKMIEQLINDTCKFVRLVHNVTDVNGFNKCDIELLKKLHNSHEAIFNVLDEIFVNASTTDSSYHETYDKIPLDNICDISVRLYNILTRCGFTYLGEIALVRDSDIKLLKNLGKKAFKELCALMDLYGISFGHENILRNHIRSFAPGDNVICNDKKSVILSIDEPLSTKSRLWPSVIVSYEGVPSYTIELRKACDILTIRRFSFDKKGE